MTKSTTESKLEERKNLMKAMQYQRYGGPSELRLAEIPRPVPTASQLLVRVDFTGTIEKNQMSGKAGQYELPWKAVRPE